MRGLRLPGSIRVRLALIYSGLLAVALAAFGLGVFTVLRMQLERAFEAQLSANAEHAADAFGESLTADADLVPDARLLAQFASTGGRVVVLDPAGVELADSAPTDAPVLTIGAEDIRSGSLHEHRVRNIRVDGTDLAMTIEPIETHAGSLVGYVVWADSTRPLEQLTISVGSALLVAGIVVLVGATFIGLRLAGRALAPIADVTETARAISLSGDLAARVQEAPEHDEVRELAIAFNEMLAALEQSHETLRRFLGDASHELRTPLTAVTANLELARRPTISDAERAQVLDDAALEADRMGRMVKDLLSLARAESGGRLADVPVELDALVVESVRRHQVRTGGVRLRISRIEPLRVDGDPDRLQELIGILLDNALRYTAAGGEVVVSAVRAGPMANIEVRDTGIGIDDEDPDRLFERLYRGARAREMRPSGTGLGLPIARWIVERHGGRIHLRRGDPGGTIASALLPLRPEARLPVASTTDA